MSHFIQALPSDLLVKQKSSGIAGSSWALASFQGQIELIQWVRKL